PPPVAEHERKVSNPGKLSLTVEVTFNVGPLLTASILNVIFCPEIAEPDVMDFVTDRSACTVTTLCTTRLSNSTPQTAAAGLTLLHVKFVSCVNSHQSRMNLPVIPFSFRRTCFIPAESPAHADIS